VKYHRVASVTGIAAVALGLALTGCGSGAKTASPASSTAAAGSSSAPSSSGKSAPPKEAGGKGLDEYLSSNHITQEAPQIGAAGVPTVTLPGLAGWSHAELDPQQGFADLLCVKYDSPSTDGGVAVVRVQMAKLTGTIDQSKLLAAAKPTLSDSGDKFRADPSTISVGDFKGWQAIVDSVDKDGKKLTITGRLIVIPGQDATYLLQEGGVASPELEGTMLDAVHLIDTQTTIQA